MRALVSTPLAALLGALGALLLAPDGAQRLTVAADPPSKGDCRRDPLRYVWGEDRLLLRRRCVSAVVVVARVGHAKDGDLHIDAIAPRRWLTRDNRDGLLVLEKMPTDRWRYKPNRGDIIAVRDATYVWDINHGSGAGCRRDCHGWGEFHPIGREPVKIGEAPENYIENYLSRSHPSATVDAANGGFAKNDQDNKITGVFASNGDPTADGILGARLPNLFHERWRWVYTQQHGDNLTYEVVPARGPKPPRNNAPAPQP